MPRFVDLTGMKFGRLTVVRRVYDEEHQTNYWYCDCECGGSTTTTSYSLKTGHTKSCGCLRRERIAASTTKHGDSHDRLYRIWQCMRNRCSNPNYKFYPEYGGRGISVCDEWDSSYPSFKEWSMSNGYEDGLTIDRIDVNGNYCPENCRWVTMSVQMGNRRNSRIVTYHGDSGCFKHMCKKLDVNYETVNARMKRGYSFEDAIDSFDHTGKFVDYGKNWKKKAS